MNTKQTHTAQQNLLFLALLQAEYAKQQNVTEQLLNILLLVVHATRLCKNDNCLPDRQNNAMHCFSSDENCFSGMDASDENCCEFANANSIAQTAGTPFVRYEWGQRVYIQYGNGVETTYTYDENRRWLENIKTVSPDLLNPVLQNISYKFDDVGNVEGYVNDAGNYRTAQTYGYDDLYQLTSANGESEYIHNGLSNYRAQYSQTFSFDAQGLGNMLTKTSSASNNQGYRLGDELNYNLDYEYDSKFVHRAKRIGKQHYLYDLNGNLISEQEGAYNEAEASSQHEVIQTGNLYSVDYGWGIVNPDAQPTSTPNITRRNYTWNERNLLKTSTDRSYSVQYKYGADGQRSAKYSVGSNGVSETLYFNKMWNWRYDSRIMQREGRVSKHIYLGETRILTKLASADNDLSAIVSEELTKQYYYHTDHLGSAQLISDCDGKEYERIEYTPYGELWIEKKVASSQIDIPFRFTGKERDEETGLYYYGARYLDAKTSRWLSTDPALEEYIPVAGKGSKDLPGIGGIYNTTNIHLYHYANNNPVKYDDPDGRFIPLIVARAAIGAAVGAVVGAGVNAAVQVGVNMTLGGMNLSDAVSNIDMKSVGSAALSGAVTGAITGGASAVKEVSSVLAVSKPANMALTAGANMAGTAVGKIADNAQHGKPLGKNLVRDTAISGALGVVQGAITPVDKVGHHITALPVQGNAGTSSGVSTPIVVPTPRNAGNEAFKSGILSATNEIIPQTLDYNK